MAFSRTAAMRRGRYEATEAIGEWTAAYDESGQMFWYDELTHETTYDPSAGRRHPQPHQAMSHTAFFARGSTNGASHMPQMPPQEGDGMMPLSSRGYPYSSPADACNGGYVTSSGHMVSARAPSYVEVPSRFSPLHHSNQQQHYQHQHHQQHYHHHQPHHQHQHHHQLGRHAYPGVTLFSGYRWEECFKMDGKKFWRHKETGVIVHKDPYR